MQSLKINPTQRPTPQQKLLVQQLKNIKHTIVTCVSVSVYVFSVKYLKKKKPYIIYHDITCYEVEKRKLTKSKT